MGRTNVNNLGSKESDFELLSSYTYDANGNTLSDAQGRSFTWDFENRLTQAVVPGTNGGTTTFKYDPFGRRIQKSGPLGTTNYLYDGMAPTANDIEEVDSSGNVLARYTQGVGVDQTLAEFRSGVSSYYEQDGIGSDTSLSNASAALANTYIYDSFGRLTASTGTLTNPFQYTGRDSDPETGIDNYRARYFDPTSGRFVSEDPARFSETNNFYSYVSNRPTRFFDPTGLAQCLYQVTAHSLTCVSTENPANQVSVDASSVSSGLGPCADKVNCQMLWRVGPIPPGRKFKMNKDDRPGHELWYRLEPVPAISGFLCRFGPFTRCGFALHLGRISEGCINVNKDDPAGAAQYQKLLQLLDSEQGENYLFTEP